MPWHVNEPTVQSFDNPVLMDMRGPIFPEFKIPHRFIFTYEVRTKTHKDTDNFFVTV
jgi:hypothetical protein